MFYKEFIFIAAVVFIGLPLLIFAFVTILSWQLSKQEVIDARTKTKFKIITASIILSLLIAISAIFLLVHW